MASRARLAILPANTERVDRVRNCVETMREELTLIREFVEAGVSFSLEIAGASGNVILRDLRQTP